MRKIKYYFAVVASLFIFAHCAVKPSPFKDYSDQELSRKQVMKALGRLDRDWSWFKAKGKISLDSEDYTGSARVYVTIKKDSVIWLRISKLALEIARVKITPDSIHGVDRVNKEYLQEDFKVLVDRYNLQLSFTDIQELFLGKALEPLRTSGEMTTEDKNYLLKARQMNREYQLYLDRVTVLPVIQTVTDYREGHLEMQYAEYMAAAKRPPIAAYRSFSVIDSRGKSYFLEISGIDPTWNQEGSTRLVVPKHYSRLYF